MLVADMEKFEFEDERNMDVFSGFVSRAKDVLTTLIDDIKGSIKDYEARIEDTTKEISDNEASREKCEHEITKMEAKIDSIKETIDNVENTYKKIADAYSSTSKGETKELYSEIIDGAKANCEKDVLKNRSEIARLNSDIEAIKNNIAEFTKIIEELNRDLETYNLELFKYQKALDYMERVYDKTNNDLEDISSRKEILKKPDIKTAKRLEPKRGRSSSKEDSYEYSSRYKDKKPSVIETLESETFETPSVKDVKEEPVKPKQDSYEDSLKQIFDLTGYTPKKEEVPVEAPKKEEKVEEKKYTDNLENLFSEPTVEAKPEAVSFLDTDFSSWENMLNTQPVMENNPVQDFNAVDQLLNAYGTTYSRLKSLVGNEIVYKDGSKIPFSFTEDDVMKAVNALDGSDLKSIKTVGPEITILRRLKSMKEGIK